MKLSRASATRRGAFLAIAAGAVLAGVSCDSFSGSSDQPSDGGSDVAIAVDGTSTDDGASSDGAKSDASVDGAAGECETLTGTIFTDTEADVTALASDGSHVYWGSNMGVWRRAASNGAGLEEIFAAGLGACTDIALGNFVAARFSSNAVRVKLKTALGADASVPNISGQCTGLDPHTLSNYFARRAEYTTTCAGGCTQIVDRDGITSIVPAPAGYDFMAPAGSVMGIFHCETACETPDAGNVLLATTSDLLSAKVASDAQYVYFLDRTAGVLRRVARAGGQPTDVITGLQQPVYLAIDSMDRFVVATFVNGVFRGPKTGCVAPQTPASNTTLGGLAVLGTTVWYAEGDAIKRVDQ